MSYTQAITEIRQLLSDTEFHKKATGKQLIGKVDANNVKFITYDKRLLSDTLEVFVNAEAVDFTLDDAVKGAITLSSAPDKNTKVTANYYWTWWNDDELITFLNKGAEATSQFSAAIPDQAYLQILPGLKTAALMLTASLATRSLIQMMINRRHSEEFLIQESGNDDTGFSQMITAMQKMADTYWKDGIAQRDDFYMRQGKRNAPAFGIKVGTPKGYGPNR